MISPDEWPSMRASWQRFKAAWRELLAVQRRRLALRLVVRAFRVDPTLAAWVAEQAIEAYEASFEKVGRHD